MNTSDIEISYILVAITFMLYCTTRILRRAGFSPMWAPLVLIPLVDIALIWVFSYSFWPSHDSYRNVKLESSKRQVIKVLSIVLTLLLYIFAVGAYFIIPSFSEVFHGFGTELPLITNLILGSYKYFIVLPLFGSAICVNMFLRSEWSVQYQYYVFGSLLGLLIIAFALIPLIIWAMYAPIFQISSVN